jgi:hypothetical protein
MYSGIVVKKIEISDCGIVKDYKIGPSRDLPYPVYNKFTFWIQRFCTDSQVIQIMYNVKGPPDGINILEAFQTVNGKQVVHPKLAEYNRYM